MNCRTALTSLCIAAASSLLAPVHAQTGAPTAGGAMPTGRQMRTSNDAMAADAMTAGEVRRVDKENKKLTIRHGDIKNLGMPGMTMVFHVGDPAMLDRVKPGDKILFRAERADGALVVTELRPAK